MDVWLTDIDSEMRAMAASKGVTVEELIQHYCDDGLAQCADEMALRQRLGELQTSWRERTDGEHGLSDRYAAGLIVCADALRFFVEFGNTDYEQLIRSWRLLLVRTGCLAYAACAAELKEVVK